MNWKKLCDDKGFETPEAMLRFFRKKKQLTYAQISVELGLSVGAIWNKMVELIEAEKLTRKDMKR